MLVSSISPPTAHFAILLSLTLVFIEGSRICSNLSFHQPRSIFLNQRIYQYFYKTFTRFYCLFVFVFGRGGSKYHFRPELNSFCAIYLFIYGGSVFVNFLDGEGSLTKTAVFVPRVSFSENTY